jgi:stage II sporulation protein D
VLQNGIRQELDLETYLTGVLRAEMPASFAPEALKAQAVAARTYTLYQLQNGGNHTDADICTNPACCQAWLDAETARQNWGASAAVYEEKIQNAIQETDGQAMFYSGEPILAVFHSSSSGLTRPAGQVWQNDLPYLQAVASPENAATIPNYHSRVEFSPEEFRSLVHAAYPNADLSGSIDTWLTQRTADAAGNVDTLCVGGVSVRGTRLRGILGLRSACFDWAVENGRLVFFVTGYGHGVGMSQYGADFLARQGYTWKEILQYYYKDVTIS